MKKDDIEKLNTSASTEPLHPEGQAAHTLTPQDIESLNGTVKNLYGLDPSTDVNAFLSSSPEPLVKGLQTAKESYNFSVLSEALEATARIANSLPMQKIYEATSSACSRLSDFLQSTRVHDSITMMTERLSGFSGSLQQACNEIMGSESQSATALLSQLMSCQGIGNASAALTASLKLNEVMNDESASEPAILLTKALAQSEKMSVWDEIRNINNLADTPLSQMMESISPMSEAFTTAARVDYVVFDNSKIVAAIENTVTLGERIRNFFSNIGTKIRDAIRSIKERISSAIIRFWRDATEIREVLFRFIQEKVFSALHRPRLPSRLSGVIKSVLRSPAVSVSGAEHVLDIKFSDYLTRLLFVFLSHRQMGEDPAHKELCFC